MSKIAEACEDDIRERFDTAGRGTWRPNALKTVRRKRANRPLSDTGTMRDSIRQEIFYDHVRVSVPYGGRKHDRSVPARHQYGMSGMPQRMIIDASAKERNRKLRDVMD